LEHVLELFQGFDRARFVLGFESSLHCLCGFLDRTVEGTRNFHYVIFNRLPVALKAFKILRGIGKVACAHGGFGFANDALDRFETSDRLGKDLRALDLGGLQVQVGGQTATAIDTIAAVAQKFPIILAATMGITFIVLCLLFESVVLPLKAIVMNFLSIGASFGALVFVFQEGHLSQWLNFQSIGYLDILLPLVLFGVVFGLSMDYEVFLLTRIKEIYDECGDNSRSVIEGLAHTGSIITNAAVLMIIVTGAFALTSIIFMKALGLGIALAILVDATLIRVILVPSTMHLMGKWNWWTPWKR
jgi:putative drug exporter of the RND superfamily